MIKVVGIRFKKTGKIYYFDPLDLPIDIGDHAIVETARGIEYGVVVTGPKEITEEEIEYKSEGEATTTLADLLKKAGF